MKMSTISACLMMLGAVSGCSSVPGDDPAPIYGAAASARPDQLSLRAADADQQQAVVAGDIAKIRAIMHSGYRVNAPTNRVMSRDEILSMFDKGIITAEPVQRTVEAAVVNGSTGIVMGRETLVPATGSPLAKTSGGQPILRRFTNIYSFENGKWWFLGRHFNQIRQ